MTKIRETDFDFNVVQLIYCSRATNAKNKSKLECDIHDILDRSRSYNPLHDITGALLTDGELFAQVIEGPSPAVESLYSRITRDERHSRVTMLQHILVHVRLLEFCSNAFLRVEGMLHVKALDARSKPSELRNASVSVLKALRPVLLKQP